MADKVGAVLVVGGGIEVLNKTDGITKPRDADHAEEAI